MFPIVEILLGLQLTLSAKAASSAQYFTAEPKDVTFKSGEHLKMPCAVGNKQGACQWTKDGFGMGINPSLPGFPRFSMGDGESEECFLNINPVLPADEGVYQCQVGAVAGVSAIASSPVVISISAEPGLPYILQAADYDVLEVLEGQHVLLDCESQGAKPPAEIKWFDGDSSLESANIKEAVTKQKDNKTFKTHSTLTLMPKQDMNIKCSSFSEQFPSIKYSRPLQIRLRYMPKINIDLSKDRIQEGDKFSVTCNSKAYPENVAYKWFFGGIEIAGEKNDTLMIEEISREHHASDVKCLVENEVGRTEMATTLNVEFPPTILTHPKSVIAKKGDNVTFHCVAEGNPEPVYIWTKEKANILAGYKQNLTLIASERTEKTYVCKVFSDGYEIISSFPARLMLIRKPVIFTESTRKGNEGQDIILQCRVDSISNKTTILWTKNDIPLVIDNVRFKVVHYNEGREQQSDLLISKLENKDFGDYGCFAANEVGKDYKTVVLINISDVEIMSYAIGISVAAGVTVLLAVYLYYRLKKSCAGEEGSEEEKIPF
eukprot:GFUD01025805.1.p1 GENE.GFUD01025805.1~~GFUD01025805.1.p1  ORF type:complete len:546 (+),score=129.94 GFUD01025805.1:193-1830(+)